MIDIRENDKHDNNVNADKSNLLTKVRKAYTTVYTSFTFNCASGLWEKAKVPWILVPRARSP